MYNDISKSFLRLSRRLASPRRLQRALKQVTDLVGTTWVPPVSPPPAPPSRPASARKAAAAPTVAPAWAAGAIAEVADFGTNPGALRMLMYLPASLPASGGALVVVLHGCGQQAALFATETGWVAMAERLGFAMVMPEQVAANNAGRCFNWFNTGDVTRGTGEAHSIREMIDTAITQARLDARRVYVVGLSAGGAMAAAMLAAYPELFAAGASVAGLPVGCASDVSSALGWMSRGGTDSAKVLAERARAIGPKQPPAAWPRVSIWQGDADHTVVAANASQLAAQFVGLHGIVDAARELPSDGKLTAREWRDARGVEVELRSIAGMAHGYPIATGTPTDRFVLPVGIDATEAIARFWGLLSA